MVAYSQAYKKKTKKILLVEDNALYREFVKSVLGLLDFSVVEAENGLNGLEIGLVEDFDLVVTDLMMPEMDGITFINEIRKVKPDTKIIAISAGGRNAQRESYTNLIEESNVDGFLQKPFRGSEMHDMVREVLR